MGKTNHPISRGTDIACTIRWCRRHYLANIHNGGVHKRHYLANIHNGGAHKKPYLAYVHSGGVHKTTFRHCVVRTQRWCKYPLPKINAIS